MTNNQMTIKKQEAIKALDHLLNTWTKNQYVRGQYYTEDGKMCAQEYIAHTLYAQGHIYAQVGVTIPTITETIRAALAQVSPFCNIMLLNDRTDYHTTLFYLTKTRDKLKSDITLL